MSNEREMTIGDLAEWARGADAIVQVQHHRRWFVDVGPVGYVHEENVSVEDDDLLTALRLAMHEYDARRLRASGPIPAGTITAGLVAPFQVPADVEVTGVHIQGIYHHDGRTLSFLRDGVVELDDDGSVVGPARTDDVEAVKTAIKEKFRAGR